MSILSFFSAPHGNRSAALRELEIDLASFRVGHSLLGERPSAEDCFCDPLLKHGRYQAKNLGIELGSTAGKLDYACIDVPAFPGRLTRAGQALGLTKTTTATDIRHAFGEPYWVDRSEAEIVMFYEYLDGTVELQFEFAENTQTLGFVTLARHGVLADPEQRRLYGVDKPWPGHCTNSAT